MRVPPQGGSTVYSHNKHSGDVSEAQVQLCVPWYYIPRGYRRAIYRFCAADAGLFTGLQACADADADAGWSRTWGVRHAQAGRNC